MEATDQARLLLSGQRQDLSPPGAERDLNDIGGLPLLIERQKRGSRLNLGAQRAKTGFSDEQ